MSSDTDHPRQRTVAELLAENGGSSTGRRRRRRDADEHDEGAPPAAPRAAAPDRRPPNGSPPIASPPAGSPPVAAPPYAPNSNGPALSGSAPAAAPPSGEGRRSRHREGLTAEPDRGRQAPVARSARQDLTPDRPQPRLGFEPTPPTTGRRHAAPADVEPRVATPPPTRANGFAPRADTSRADAPRADAYRADGLHADPDEALTDVRRLAFDGGRTVPEVRPASLTGPVAPEAAPGRLAPPPRNGAATRPAWPAPPEPRSPEPRSPEQRGAQPEAYAPPPRRPVGPDARPEQARSPWAPERHTEQMPRVRQAGPTVAPHEDDDTGPIAIRPPSDDGGPPTMLGAPPLAEDLDGGPPTEADAFGPALDDDLDDDVDEADLDARDAVGATTAVKAPIGRRPLRDRPAGLDDAADEDADVDHDLDDEADVRPQAWAVVVAQWVAGAVVGAGLWVGFRYLWFNLPVVALAAAVLVTVALVLAVRALLRNDDLRTTIFAVLVGLLLTVSPAILVLLGR